MSADDVRTLARLYQLQNKMEAVGAVGAYDARLERVLVARSAVEERLVKRLDLIDGFARVVNMIEIEVGPSILFTSPQEIMCRGAQDYAFAKGTLHRGEYRVLACLDSIVSNLCGLGW